MSKNVVGFPWWKRKRPRLSEEEGEVAARRILETPIADRSGREQELHLDDPWMLLILSWNLAERLESAPELVRTEAEYLYRFLEKLKPRWPIEPLMKEERLSRLGDFALLAGTACRHLTRRDEARTWFDRAEVWFQGVVFQMPHFAMVSYQRLALKLEERQFEEVFSLQPALFENCLEMEMKEEAVKCHFLEAVALKETGRLEEAISLFRELVGHTEKLGDEKLLGWAYVNLVQLHAFRGEAAEAIAGVGEAAPVLRRVNNRMGLAKLQWGIGTMLRARGQVAEAVEAYRAAQEEFRQIEMEADVAAIHLVIADLLLDLGQDKQARWEVQMALPVIDELKLVPEGMAALSLLRESLQSARGINREALRNLHGYFPGRDS